MAGHTDNGARRGNPWSPLIWGGAAALLALPLIAMRFTSEVAWGPEDFAVMGVMLALVCGAFELIMRASGDLAYRVGAGVAVLTAFLLVWVNLAVGFIGNEDSPANLMFGGVIAIGVVGAILARFRPSGMAKAMVAAGIAQASASGIGLAMQMNVPIPPTIVFTALWLGSAWLFKNAARGEAH